MYEAIKNTLVNKIAQVLNFSESEVSLKKSFSSYGLDSIIGVELINEINEALGIVLKTIVVFDYPNVEKLSQYIYDNYKDKIQSESKVEVERPALSSSPSDSYFEEEALFEEDLFEATNPAENGQVSAPKQEQTTKEAVQSMLVQTISDTMQIPADEISTKKSFSSFGIDSIIGVELINELNEKLGIVLKTIVIFDYSNVDKLTGFILENYGKQLEVSVKSPQQEMATPQPQQFDEKFEAVDDLFDEDFDEPLQEAPTEAFSTEGTWEEDDIFGAYFDDFDLKAPENEGTKKADIVSNTGTGFQAVLLEKPVVNGAITVKEISPTDPGPGEVQVLVKAFPINFSDFLLLKGLYPIMPDFPFTPGVEVAGIIRKVGKGVKEVQVGDEVIALTRPEMGGQGAVVNTDANFVVKKPANVSHEEAGGFAVPFLSMYVALEKAALQANEKILIQTGTGNNGLIAIQLAQLAGAEIITTVSSKEKAAFLKKMGVKHIINHTTEDFEQRVMEITHNYGVDVVINTVGGEAIQKGLNLVAPNGRYIELAVFGLQTASGLNLSKLIDNQIFYSLNIKKFFLDAPQKRQKYLNIMASYLSEGKVKPILHKTFPFSQIKTAYAEKEKREVIGRVMVAMPTINTEQAPPPKTKTRKDIAIIGYSGRFPDAANVEELWKNLCNEKDSVIEVPEERWSNEVYYDPNPTSIGKTYCKWGAFIDDFDKFDANFFSISPKEATQTDPQQRIFLQESYRAIEHAGYSETKMNEKRCGVFVGVGPGGYLKRMEENGVTKYAQAFWGNETSILAARISYYLNLKGPSIAINTACSSSLVAAHLACASILSGESDMAIAGGVFISIDPDYYLVASNGNMLSPEGKCKTFDNDANGFGPGEAAAAMILKPLEDALRDGDHIHGIIKGSSINQDGKTNGITAPSTLSQTQVELEAYANAGINPETISYIEAHGTGTKLGDPIEIEALNTAFKKHTDKKQFCRIGSIKTNIGHTAAAAGITGIVKILLALKYGKIPASINFEKPNEHIDFQDSPFAVNRELTDWNPTHAPVKRAAISSFGFSGTNAHMVLEEAPVRTSISQEEKPYYLIPLSAEDENVLALRKRELLDWLNNETDFSIQNIAYTLQSREHFHLREAYLVRNIEELKQQLALENAKPSPTKPSIELNKLYSQLKAEGEENYKENLNTIAEHYRHGKSIDWENISATACFTLPLPAYPFIGERYWIEENKQGRNKESLVKNLHPLVHQNVSTLKGYRFESSFDGKEFFLKNHIVNEKPMFPGAAYIEMGLAAAKIIGNSKDVLIKDVNWLRPFIVAAKRKLFVEYTRTAQDQFSLKFVDEQELLYASFEGLYHRPTAPSDTVELGKGKLLDPTQLYERFKGFGLDYGADFQPIKFIWQQEKEATAILELSPAMQKTVDSFSLHPALLDGAFQSLIAFYGFGEQQLESQYLPFSIGEIKVHKTLPATCYLKITDMTNMRKAIPTIKYFDIILFNEQKEVLTEIKSFAIKQVKRVKAAAPTSAEVIFQQLQEGKISDKEAEKALDQLLTRI